MLFNIFYINKHLKNHKNIYHYKYKYNNNNNKILNFNVFYIKIINLTYINY
jgi:hypothetical protein